MDTCELNIVMQLSIVGGHRHFKQVIGIRIWFVLEAIAQGLNVYFVSLAQLISILRKPYEENPLDKRMRVYLRPRILIVDKVGYLPLDLSLRTCSSSWFVLATKKAACSLPATKALGNGENSLRQRIGNSRCIRR